MVIFYSQQTAKNKKPLQINARALRINEDIPHHLNNANLQL